MEKTIIEVVMSKHKHMKERKMSIEVPAQKRSLKMEHIIDVNDRDHSLFLPPSVVISIVSTQTGIPYDLLLENSESRETHYVFSKMMLSVYLLNFTDMTLANITRVCGQRSHATVKNYIKNFISYSEQETSKSHYNRLFHSYTAQINNKIIDSLYNITNINTDTIIEKLIERGLINKAGVDKVHITREHYTRLTYNKKWHVEVTYGNSMSGKSIHIKSSKHGMESHIHFSLPEFMAFTTQINQLMLTSEVQEYALGDQFLASLREMEKQVLKIERTFEE